MTRALNGIPLPPVVVQLADAMRPVLIPVEQQDVAIQARNTVLVDEIALDAWNSFIIAKPGGCR